LVTVCVIDLHLRVRSVFLILNTSPDTISLTSATESRTCLQQTLQCNLLLCRRPWRTDTIILGVLGTWLLWILLIE